MAGSFDLVDSGSVAAAADLCCSCYGEAAGSGNSGGGYSDVEFDECDDH